MIKLHVNGNCITDSLEIAHCFNDYFASVGPDLSKDIVSTTNPMS